MDTAELILRELATGLMSLHSRDETMRQLYAYPAPLQRSFERLILYTVSHKLPSPQSLMDILYLCTKPMAEWYMFANVSQATWAETDRLINWGLPTAFCEELSCDNLNVADELEQNQIFLALRRLCKEHNSQRGYVGFRRLFIERPIIQEFELATHLMKTPLNLLAEPLRSVYEPIPLIMSSNGSFRLCPSCGVILQRTIHNEEHCESDTCRELTSKISPKEIPASASWLRLRRPFRRYITHPGLAEVRLARQLEKSNIQVELWPHFDRYDLRLTLPSGEVWAVDVKDWSNPRLLAKHLLKPDFPIDYDRFYYVIPQHRLKYNHDYVRVLEAYSPYLQADGKALSERQFSSLIRKHTA
ncbi:restriction endonuclease-related protein [Spirosoma fluviale]|uniref:REase associating with pPIWI RE domain-containing protein n=1 Tax=Spirosoma fluviale TaxID=1597977 RepID=A0A286G281_9BACT|nr:hypothetical protein [Spirosoma fluviale]SOD89289.1 hypothetical protein SAMN06269250_3013 [Spirosoma fluviale]